MNWKKHLLHGAVAGLLAGIAGLIYLTIYRNAFETHFDKIINPGAIVGSCVFGCVLMGIGYALLEKWNKENLKGILNIVIALLSFASIVGGFAVTLPADITTPELFPGLVVPMHFFPALAFFAIVPFFESRK